MSNVAPIVLGSGRGVNRAERVMTEFAESFPCRCKPDRWRLHSGVMTRAARPCPICRAEVPWEDNPFRPFCSERCQLTDLSHWLGERYRVPGEPPEDESATLTGGDTDDSE